MDSFKKSKVKKAEKYVFPASYAREKEQIIMIRKSDNEVIVFSLIGCNMPVSLSV